MLKAIFWVMIVLAALIVGLGFAAARKSARMTAPVFIEGTLPPCADKPNCVSSEVALQHPAYIQPLPALPGIRELQTQIEAMGGKVTSISDNLLQAEFRTSLFKFTDDLLVQLDSSQNVFRLRSSSRVGHSDLGANRKRVEALRLRINRQGN